MAIGLIIAAIVVAVAILVGVDAISRRRRPSSRIEHTRKWRRDNSGPG